MNPFRPGAALTGKTLADAFRSQQLVGDGLLVAAGPGGRTVRQAGPQASRPVVFWAKLSGATLVSGFAFRWSYQWLEVQLATNTATGWVSKTGGRNHANRSAAFNLREASNGNTGVLGNGVDPAALPAGFTVGPVVTGIVVAMHEVVLRAGNGRGYWFAEPNPVLGACP